MSLNLHFIFVYFTNWKLQRGFSIGH